MPLHICVRLHGWLVFCDEVTAPHVEVLLQSDVCGRHEIVDMGHDHCGGRDQVRQLRQTHAGYAGYPDDGVTNNLMKDMYDRVT